MIPFTFDADSHIYTIEGDREVPGCTRVIDTAGLVNYRFVRPDILERKSRLGREAHRVTKLYDDGRLDFSTVDSRVEPYLESWIAFKRQTGFVSELREHQAIADCDGMKYGMQLDACGFSGKGGRKSIETIVEIKCTVTVMPHHFVQVAGYALGLPRLVGKIPVVSPMARFLGRRKLIVQLTAKGTPKIHEGLDREDAETFLRALWMSEWRRKHEQMYREAA